jgi:hypothetical protein
MTRRSSAIAFAAALSVPAAAQAQPLPNSINEPPRGPGTEQAEGYQAPGERIRPGWEAGAQVGGGIGIGVGARGGYTFRQGLYLGGSFTYFFGPNVTTIVGNDRESQAVFGGDFGIKLFPKPDVELRPYIFAGIGIFDQLNQNIDIVDTSTDFTVWPGFLAAYHFGNAYISGESRLEVAPTPIHFALLAGLGLGI